MFKCLINIENAKYSLREVQLRGELLVGLQCPPMTTGRLVSLYRRTVTGWRSKEVGCSRLLVWMCGHRIPSGRAWIHKNSKG